MARASASAACSSGVRTTGGLSETSLCCCTPMTRAGVGPPQDHVVKVGTVAPERDRRGVAPCVPQIPLREVVERLAHRLLLLLVEEHFLASLVGLVHPP